MTEQFRQQPKPEGQAPKGGANEPEPRPPVGAIPPPECYPLHEETNTVLAESSAPLNPITSQQIEAGRPRVPDELLRFLPPLPPRPTISKHLALSNDTIDADPLFNEETKQEWKTQEEKIKQRDDLDLGEEKFMNDPYYIYLLRRQIELRFLALRTRSGKASYSSMLSGSRRFGEWISTAVQSLQTAVQAGGAPFPYELMVLNAIEADYQTAPTAVLEDLKYRKNLRRRPLYEQLFHSIYVPPHVVISESTDNNSTKIQ